MVAPPNERESLSDGAPSEQMEDADNSASSEPQDKPHESSGNIASDTITPSSSSSSSPASSPLDWNPRQTVGKTMHVVSDWVNENLVAARYAALAGIGLLAAYGISQTPLFFRYRTVAEIPARLFTQRRTLTGRLMVCRRRRGGGGGADKKDSSNKATTAAGASPNNNNNHPTAAPVTCFVRHLSPMERLLSKSWLNRLLQIHPAATLQRQQGRPEESPHELLRVQVAGLVYPSLPENNETASTTMSSTSSSGSLLQQISIPDDLSGQASSNNQQQQAGQEWLRQLAEDRVVVKCKLLGREVPKRPASEEASLGGRSKRAIPGFEETTTAAKTNTIRSSTTTTQAQNESSHADADQVAVALVRYYPKRHPLLGADLGEHMVQSGRAVPSADGGLYAHSASERVVVDATQDVPTLRRHDTAYAERLERAEYRACHGSYGVWKDPAYRASRPDVVEEVEFQQTAPWFRKAWRWLRAR